jgi:hypothetical protein
MPFTMWHISDQLDCVLIRRDVRVDSCNNATFGSCWQHCESNSERGSVQITGVQNVGHKREPIYACQLDVFKRCGHLQSCIRALKLT